MDKTLKSCFFIILIRLAMQLNYKGGRKRVRRFGDIGVTGEKMELLLTVRVKGNACVSLKSS